MGKKLHVTRDAIFEEVRAWNWKIHEDAISEPATFTVNYTNGYGLLILDAGHGVTPISSPPVDECKTEYSGLCLLAVEEPVSVEAALTDVAWMRR